MNSVIALSEDKPRLYRTLKTMLMIQMRKEFMYPFLVELTKWLWQYIQRTENTAEAADERSPALASVTTNIKVIYAGRELLEQLLLTYESVPSFESKMYFLCVVSPAWNDACKEVLRLNTFGQSG